MSGRFIVKTLGCKANASDGQVLEHLLREKGWTPARAKSESAELIIVNSCTVTDEADRQSRKLAQKLAGDHPDARVVLTGCGADVHPDLYRETPGVDFVVGNIDKPKLIDLVLSESPDAKTREGKTLGKVIGYSELLSKHPIDREWPLPTNLLHVHSEKGRAGSKTRAFLKIQDGCNSFCTFCIIPYGRGPSRSLPISELVSQVGILCDQGMREVVLTGTNIGEYGVDLGESLENLIEALLEKTQVQRLRLSSLDPLQITPRILSLMKECPRLCPHFHVSLQSPSSKILRLMKRNYGHDEVKSCLEAITELGRLTSQPGGIFVGMDLITGFPGEDEETFQWTKDVLTELPWTRLHVFPYSERAGTPAARLPKSVPQHVRKARAKTLNALSFSRIQDHYRNLIGHTFNDVLLEGESRGPDGTFSWRGGYTPNYLRFLTPLKKMDDQKNQVHALVGKQLVLDRPSGDVAFLSA